MNTIWFEHASERRELVRLPRATAESLSPDIEAMWTNAPAARISPNVSAAAARIAQALVDAGAPVWILLPTTVVDVDSSDKHLRYERSMSAARTESEIAQFRALEYEQLTGLITHWDGHTWHKSNFFFAVETVMLGGMGIAFQSQFVNGVPAGFSQLMLFTAVAMFNMWLCYVWFRTSRSNRDYLRPLFIRARVIEAELGDERGVYTDQRNFIEDAKLSQHGSSGYEIHVPNVFALAWLVAWMALTAKSLLTHVVGQRAPANLGWVVGPMLLFLAFVGWREYFHPKRPPTTGSASKAPTGVATPGATLKNGAPAK